MVQVLHLKKIKKGLAKYAALFLAASLSMSVAAVEYAANFKGTDINEFINIVGKNLNKTIIIDPNVRGKVNVRSYELMDEALYYQFFLNVLEVYGYSAVEMDNNITKWPVSDACTPIWAVSKSRISPTITTSGS